ncbi:hypothetical protein [Ralstonia pseudosolanacearum]|uniref:hypothetical protein n=1 Tax=Ralstonia pseudosolanacearum TaxID=1310165 RepID=UPI00048E640A|nr:hypothetical protein [Ralstonia pseudosolanacearum]MDO3558293.1 hypothetical protein [Ralstonia pseudosolanacearum]MDO3575514.1 hypothetical protein [Ralstonia pseudosolanacearum]MDO3586886.1 hypothetical protein [Ralstonia pseudosolanacearum]
MKRSILVIAALSASLSSIVRATEYAPQFPGGGPWLVATYDGACVPLKEGYGASSPKELFDKMTRKGEDAKLNPFDENDAVILDNTQRHFRPIFLIRGEAFCLHMAEKLKRER